MRIKLLSCILIMQCALAQEKPIILWDLHEVLFYQKNFIPLLFKYPYLSQLISNISWSFIKDLIKNGVTNIEYLPIAQKYHNPYLQEFLAQVTNDVTPIASTHAIVEELAQLGYEQHIGSNISAFSFKQLTNPQLYPAYASFFALFNIPASQTGYITNGIAIKKPNPQFFLDYLAKNNFNLAQQPIIFIDDKRGNVLAARQLGFDAIQFTNEAQLRADLRKRGINVAPPAYTVSDQHRSYILSKSSPK